MIPPEAQPSATLRAVLVVAGLVLLLIWGATLPSALAAIRDPQGDAFELIPAFWATVTALPLGALALLGGISRSPAHARRGKVALYAAGGLLAIVLLLEPLRRVLILIED